VFALNAPYVCALSDRIAEPFKAFLKPHYFLQTLITPRVMKSLRPLLFFFFSFLIGFTSCTVEKRVHMPGYHTTWNKAKHKSDRLETKNDDVIQTAQDEQVVEEEQLEKSSIVIEIPLTAPVQDDVTSASLEENSAALVDKAPMLPVVEENLASANAFPETDESAAIPSKRALRNKLKELNSDSSASESGGNGALRGIGWVLIILGLLFLLIISILIGALLLLLGLVFVIAGAK
jgi:hypothetical protein